jgi:dihydroorotate dehydrogenase (NAD+) catalytic subunit
VHPVAVWSVWSSWQAIKIPIIGMGGVHSWQSAVELMLAGASAVAVGMYNFVNPRAMKDVIEGIARYLEEEGISSVRELIGKAHG